MVDSAVYPCIAASYIVGYFPASEDENSDHFERNTNLMAMALIVFITLIKLAGTEVLVRASSALAVASFFPILLYMLWGTKELKPHQWVSTEYPGGLDNMDKSLLISWVIWLNAGFLGFGSLAGEVADVNRTLVRVIVVLLPLTVIINSLPLMVSLGLDDHLESYYAGYFEELTTDLGGGKWFPVLMIMGAAVSSIGLYTTQSMIAERSVAQFAESRYKSFFVDLTGAKLAERKASVRFLFDKRRTGVGSIYVLSTAVVELLLVWAGYEVLVELSMLVVTPSVLLMLFSFLYFRIHKPEMPRPFRIPGGMAVAWPMALFPAAIVLANAYFSIVDTTALYGIPLAKTFFLLLVIGVGFIIHALSACRDARRASIEESM